MSPFPPWPDRGPGHRKAPARGAGSRRGFGSTWWGRAWVEALEGGARLDANRLPRGRSYARSGAVGELSVGPGAVQADVQGRRSRPYRVNVRVRAFSPPEWERVLDAVGAQLGHAAALLDGELPPELVADAESAGTSLLPGAGELGPRCSCPDQANPCKHAAAVCYLVADVVDRDPFALLLLRGRSRAEVLSGLRARRSTVGAQPPGPPVPATDEGVQARQVFAAVRAPMPRPPPAPAGPGAPAVLPVDPPAGSGVTRESVRLLAADAAARAWEVLTGTAGADAAGLQLDAGSDLARRAAQLLGSPAFDDLARRAGVAPRALARRALAWRAGGAGGLRVLEEPWHPDPDELEEAVDDLRAHCAAYEMPGTRTQGTRTQGTRTQGTRDPRVQGNRVTCGAVQLRLGHDGLWYRLDKVRGTWELHRPGDGSPARLLAGG